MTRDVPNTPLVGSSDHDDLLQRLWTARTGSLAVLGLEGVGKSHRVQAFVQTHPGCTWVDCAGRVTLKRLDHRGALVVFDGCDLLDEPTLLAALDLAQTTAVVFTSRQPLPIPLVDQRIQQPLSAADALELLRIRAAQGDAPPAHLDEDGLIAIVEELDGLPAALEQAARYLEVHSAGRLADILEAGTSEIARRLRAPWERAWMALDPGTRGHLTALTAFVGGFDLTGACAVWQVDDADAADRLRSLRRRGLVQSMPLDSGARFTVGTSLVRWVGVHGDPDLRADANRRHAAYFADRVGLADATLGASTPPAPLPAIERGNLAAVCAPERAPSLEHAVRAALGLALQATTTGDVEEPIHHLQELLEPLERSPDLDPRWPYRVHHQLSFLHLAGGDARLGALHTRAALQRVPADAPPLHRLLLLQKSVWAHWRSGAPEAALEAALLGSSEARRVAHPFYQVDFLGLTAMLHSEAGRFAERDVCLRALEACAGVPAATSMRDVWNDVCGRHDDAPVTISPDSVGLVHRLVQTTSLGKSLSLLWLGRNAEVRLLADRVLADLVEPRLIRTREAILAAVSIADQAPPHDLGPLDAVVFELDSQGCPEGATGYRLLRAGGLWRDGNVAQAAQQFRVGLQDAEQCGLLVMRDEFRVLQAVCEAQLGAVTDPALPHLAGAQPRTWFANLHQLAVQILLGQPVSRAPEPGDRWSMQLLRAIAGGAGPGSQAPVTVLVVARDHTWFTVGDKRGDLRRRHTGRRLFAALLDRHRAEPGVGLSRSEAIEIGWPGQKMLLDSGSARLDTLVWQLRRLGLAGLLLTTAKGYSLREDVVVQTREPEQVPTVVQ